MDYLLDLFLHLDTHLGEFVSLYGVWIYGLLFLIVFAETGLVVTPFLPGDSLLFAAGALAAASLLDLRLILVLLVVAAILGDAVNYSVGHFVGPRVFHAEDRTSFWHRLLNRDHLREAHGFFERYGGKAIVLGRFVPIVRTFVPFVAGCGSMSYPQFAFYNVMGGIAWVGLCVGAGYAFGNMPWVKDNFTFVVLGIVFVSLLPMAWHFFQRRFHHALSGDADTNLE
ncbi:MAG: DedA family protein [Planctomycetes bacterium]|nr:DedA family protein [Planctomycetota bacterium]